jgi:hypothetical protein
VYLSSHISFVTVGLAPADFKLLLAPRPSVAPLHFPVLPRGVTIPANVAASFIPEPFFRRGVRIFLILAVLMGQSHSCKQIFNGWGGGRRIVS